jgi:hypothetical protein
LAEKDDAPTRIQIGYNLVPSVSPPLGRWDPVKQVDRDIPSNVDYYGKFLVICSISNRISLHYGFSLFICVR